MSAGLPYLVVIRGDEGPVDCYGPVSSINAESAAREALSGLGGMDFSPYEIEVYPVGVTPEGDIERVEIDAEVLGE